MSRLITVSRLVAMLLLAAVTLGFAATAASAAPARTKIDADLTALWTKVLETPSAQNAFGSGGAAYACWNIGGGTVAPFGLSAPSCTVKPGTKIFVAAYSNECSTFEEMNLTTDKELPACAEAGDATTASVTVDGHSVPVKEVETRLMNIVLPADNLFSPLPAVDGLSVGAGWVAHLHPLTPGTHTIAGSGELPSGEFSFTTKIIVKPS